jgi:hypothetical protein
LYPGRWFHNTKVGKDLTDLEFKGLKPDERSGFVPITTASEAYEVMVSPGTTLSSTKEAGHMPSPIRAKSDAGLRLVQTSTSNPNGDENGKSSIHKIYKSSLSGLALVPGNWYHRKDADYDVSIKELRLFSSEEQSHYVPISSDADVERYVEHRGDLQQELAVAHAPIAPSSPQSTDTATPNNDQITKRSALPEHHIEAYVRAGKPNNKKADNSNVKMTISSNVVRPHAATPTVGTQGNAHGTGSEVNPVKPGMGNGFDVVTQGDGKSDLGVPATDERQKRGPQMTERALRRHGMQSSR